VHPELSAQLRCLLAETFWLLPNAQEIEAIVPVPLHGTRQHERRFNQAEIIAQALSHLTGVPIYQTALLRAKATALHRGGMDAQARQQSLRGAFQVRAPRLIENRSVLLVDDVMTTGATAHEIAQTLQTSGAREVKVLTLARASHLVS
ncbi:MAG TPA: phosphoribosyltransferase family protein, partial [Blastocatellia bacterium]|nr:phosphoribosyltransferase family protein [Blastocatellia bacterium]